MGEGKISVRVFIAAVLILPSRALPKNVLMMTSDSMDGRVLDSEQHIGRSVAMPNLRGLAARGTNFVNTYTHSPVCGPSRASALTSRFVHDIGTYNNYQEIVASPVGLDTRCVSLYGEAQCSAWAAEYPVPDGILFDAFVDAGYDVKVFGKVDVGANVPARFSDPNDQVDHTGPEARCVPRGAGLLRNSMAWDGWSASTGNNNAFDDDNKTSAAAAEWLLERGRNATAKPWFLYYGLNIPHPPFISGPEWLALVNASTIHPPWLPNSTTHPYDWHMSVSKGCTEPTTYDEMMTIRRVYLAMCAQADAFHGAVLDALNASGLGDDTIIVYWSDHGEMAFEARQVLKDSFREPSSRVPLIFSGPGITAARKVSSPSSLLDLWPTLADLTGIRAPKSARGYSLAGAMDAIPIPRAQDYVVGEFHAENSDTGSYFIRRGDWKYIAYGHSFPWFSHYVPQLFNLTEDPLETTNLASSFPSVAADLDALLNTALGTPYATIDATVMANDQLIYRNYLTAGMSVERQQKLMNETYKGFDDSDWQKILTWNATAPNAQGV